MKTELTYLKTRKDVKTVKTVSLSKKKKRGEESHIVKTDKDYFERCHINKMVVQITRKFSKFTKREL